MQKHHFQPFYAISLLRLKWLTFSKGGERVVTPRALLSEESTYWTLVQNGLTDLGGAFTFVSSIMSCLIMSVDLTL